MINRILIRIKVVQMLYSYLLTRTEFKIKRPADTDTSTDALFAFRVYHDLLLLLLEISGVDTHANPTHATVTTDRKMKKVHVAKELAADDDLRRIIVRDETDIDTLRPLAQHLHDKVVTTAAFLDFAKKIKHDMNREVAMWCALLETTIADDSQLDKAFRALDGYSTKGFKRGVNMVEDTLRSYYGVHAGYLQACDELQVSLDKAYELYHSIFALMVEITREQERRIEAAKYKHLASAKDLNPNTRFIDNALVQKLCQSPELEKYMNDHHVSWETDVALISKLLDLITSSEIYRDYMDAESTDVAADCEFWRNVLRNIVFVSDDLAEALENKSVYWNDDLPIMGTFVLKTIRQAALNTNEDIKLLPQYKDEEDAKFGAELFEDTIEHRDEYRAMIDKFINTGNWDPERMAFMDIVVMMTAISELINYPNIPIPVTMNEYIEIANSYSTSKSGQFVNGILYNVAADLRAQGRIAK